MILVGGFLGAGKTTLLAAATERLLRRGHRVGLITNDQAADLVDTRLLEAGRVGVREVSAGCFCCNFNRLMASADELLERFRPDVLLTEPVGSCADLSATVLRPIQAFCREKFALAPLTVLVDPGRLTGRYETNEADDLLGPRVTYIFDKQLEEADALALAKVDALAPPRRRELVELLGQRFPGRRLLELSARGGEGVDGWLDYVLGDHPAGQRSVAVDYDTYAAGEAELGWLNALAKLRAAGEADWPGYARRMLLAVREQCRARAAEIAHVKLFLNAPPAPGAVTANLVASGAEPSVQGEVAPAARNATLIVNARVRIDPGELKAIAERALREAGEPGITAWIQAIRHFRPGRPNPTHRLPAADEKPAG